MTKKILDWLFLGLILAILTAGLLRTVLRPRDVNTYENRYAEKLPAFTAASFLDGSFQDGVDAALADQVHLAQYCKKLYNTVSSAYLRTATELLVPRDSGRYVNYDGTMMFGDSLVYTSTYLPWVTPAMDARAELYNALFAAHPELEFSVFYVERDSDVNMETGEKPGTKEYLFERIALPEERKAAFEINSYAEFSAYYYRTDHHWSCDGSYLAYTEVLELLNVTEEPVSRGEKAAVGTMSGSKAKGSASGFSETFYATPYAFPEMEITINGAPAADYGRQSAVLSAPGGSVNYASFYGGDDGEIVFSTGTEGRGKLLVLGESYDNAILKLLASHFDEVYSVDLRYYEHYMGEPFRLGEYTAARGIDRVLLIGCIDYFFQPTFAPED